MVFKQNRTPFEEHVGSHLRPLLQEPDRVLQLEIDIMIICLRPKTDLLYNDHHALGLNLFLLFLQLIQELAVINDPAYRWIGIGGYLYQISSGSFSHG